MTFAGSSSPLLPQEESVLMAGYAAGDAAAARRLAQVLTPRAYGQALRMLADAAEAEDVAQEAMLRLWQMAPAWRPGEARVTTWLYRVVANLATDRLRARRPAADPAVLDLLEDPSAPAGAGLQEASRARALSEALSRLPARQAQAIALRHLEELGNPDIAQIMDLQVEAVESLLARGKRGLAAALAGRRDELGYQDD